MTSASALARTLAARRFGARRYRRARHLALAGLALLLAWALLRPTALAAQPVTAGPEDAYRAYYQAAPELDDPQALGQYRADIAAGRMERNFVDIPDRMAQRADFQRRVFAHMAIDSIRTIERRDEIGPYGEEGDLARLEVYLRRQDDAPAPDTPEMRMLPARAVATVTMVRPDDRWTILRERFNMGADFERCAQRRAQGKVPARDRYSMENASNVLNVRSVDGTRTFSFADALLIVRDGTLRVRLPSFGPEVFEEGGFQLDMRAEGFSLDAARYDAVLDRDALPSAFACFRLPADDARLVPGRLRMKRVELPDPEAGPDEEDGYFRGAFSFITNSAENYGFFGRIDTGHVVEIEPLPVKPTSSYVVDGEETRASHGMFVYDPERRRLDVFLRQTEDGADEAHYVLENVDEREGPHMSTRIGDDARLFLYLAEINEGEIEGVIRKVRDTEEVASEMTPAMVNDLGEPVAAFASEHVVILPKMDPLRLSEAQ